MKPGFIDATTGTVTDKRVLIFPPSRRDGDATARVLQDAGLSCTVCLSAASIARELNVGAGAVAMTDIALHAPDFGVLASALGSQPAWSDIPVVLLCGPDAGPIPAILTNVTILDRPTSARTLTSAVQAAIRNRLRQYETRRQLAALEKAHEELRSADQRKDEFLAMLAHELRNPLAPIRNTSELLARMSADNAQLDTAARIIQRQITQLSRLVDDLLDVSRITRGRIALQRQPVDLRVIVDQAMESVEPLVRERRHTTQLTAGDAALYVQGDKARLVQCVANLLTNAAKYTDVGGKISVELREEADLAVVAITDSGVGIPPDLLPKVFELFVQSERSLDRAQGGLGIGLSVVRQLIAMHDGTVRASSDGLGHGARFELRLPTIPAPRTEDPAPPVRQLAAKKILVVDDNVDAADSLAMVLNQRGHEAEAVFSPSAAIERAATLNPEVVLLDIGLPGMDGYEVAQRIRAAGGSARLVALTGYGQPEDIRKARAAGFDAHLVKPVDLENLMRSISDQP